MAIRILLGQFLHTTLFGLGLRADMVVGGLCIKPPAELAAGRIDQFR